ALRPAWTSKMGLSSHIRSARTTLSYLRLTIRTALSGRRPTSDSWGPVVAGSEVFTPTADPSLLFDLGVLGVPLPQYLGWADRVGLFRLMADREAVTADEVAANTRLNRRGAEAFLGLLTGLGIVELTPDERYALGAPGRQYLDRRSPYYVGLSLYGMLDESIPERLTGADRVRRLSEPAGDGWGKIQALVTPYRWRQLLVQHSRNFPAAVVGARSGRFDGIRHLADIAGGTGVFSIPLVLDRPDLRVTLVELPRNLPHVGRSLRKYGVEDRIELSGFDVYHPNPWPLHPCDGILFGNFLHTADDDECRFLLRRSFETLEPGGRILLHEMLWNERRDGPRLTALWNFWMIANSAGRQRTLGEFRALLEETGFVDVDMTPTAGCFSLVTATKAA
ncbi:MAG: methyltransferase, partial [Alphaproteobacteria bacterium]